MKKFFKFIRDHYGEIFRGFLFIISIAFIVYLFPREGKFRYEFQKGKPWLHENLIAPFDFAINKSDKELATQKDSILNEFSRYFKYDSEVYFNQLNSFTKYFEEKWDEHFKKYFRLNYNENYTNYISDSIGAGRKKKECFNFACSILEFIYSKGVIEITDIIQNDNIEQQSNVSIFILKDNIAEEYDIAEVFTPAIAKEYIIQQTRLPRLPKRSGEQVNNHKNELVNNLDTNFCFLTELKLYEFVIPNLFYDEETSEKVKNSLIENISLTKGIVQEGERIISQGDVVNNGRYRILESLKYEYETNLVNQANFYLILFGQIILIFVSILVLYLFLYHFRKDILQNSLKTFFILFLVVLFVFIASMTIKHQAVSIYLIPFVILPIIIRTFYDARLALFIHLVTVLIVGFLAPNGFEFVFLQLIAGIVAIFSLANIRRRSQLFLLSGIVFITYCFIYFGISIIQEGDIFKIYLKNFAWFAGNGLLLLSSYPLIYIFEKLFGFLSDVTLIELSDTNHPLLRKLAENAPGTFQHSLQVANLAEEAIYKIGGNPLLIRTGALYHDIGKMNMHLYFIENQTSELNPHDKLEFDKSADIIINHVKTGVEFAKKHNLPEQIIDFLKTHHGTTRVQYFYSSWIKKYPENEVDVNKFTYPGPTPFSKETAVLMMADSVEAASRSLKTINEETINEVVENIIDYQTNEQQFANADITFKDISTVKKIFKNKLMNIYHARIEYPK